ncbi:HypC/HybG/HupF family hydrogenase formation chaperone [Candidatus Latescibacterota bacterium]
MCLAIPLVITRILDENRAVAGSDGFEMEINVALVPQAREGDYVLVHAGFALEIIDQNEAEETNRLLRELIAL